MHYKSTMVFNVNQETDDIISIYTLAHQIKGMYGLNSTYNNICGMKADDKMYSKCDDDVEE